MSYLDDLFGAVGGGVDDSTSNLLNSIGDGSAASLGATFNPNNFDFNQGGDLASAFGKIDWSNLDPSTANILLGNDGSGIDWENLFPGGMSNMLQGIGGLGSALGSSGSSGGSGGSSGSGGGMGGLLKYLPALLAAGGGLYGNSQNKKASQQVQDSIAKANDQITGMFGKAQEGFQPYIQQGATSLSNLANMNGNIAQNFKPLGSGRGIK